MVGCGEVFFFNIRGLIEIRRPPYGLVFLNSFFSFDFVPAGFDPQLLSLLRMRVFILLSPFPALQHHRLVF